MPTTAVCTERLRACPLCHCPGVRPVCAARDRLYGLSDQPFAYALCGGCGLLFQSHRPVEADIAAFYPSHYGPYQAAPAVRRDGPAPPQGPHAPLHPGFRRRVKQFVTRAAGRLNAALARRLPDPLPGVLNEFYTPPRPGLTLLDFGCGSESFLNHARQRGWATTIGVDFAPDVVAAVRRAGHRGLPVGPGLWEQIPDGSVDRVRMNHVLEHLYDPRAVLAQLRRKLRPGGRLHLATPNAACLTFRLLRSRWFSLDCPRHIMLFAPRTARPLLRECGFRRVRCYQEVLTKDAARSLGYLLQDWGRLDGAGVLGMMDRPGLAGVLFAPARLASLAGAADRFHAIAEV